MSDINETATTIIEAIKPLAEKIGEGAAHLYQIYTQQMFAEGLIGLILSGLCLVVLVACIVVFSKNIVKAMEDDDAKSIGFMVASGIIGITLGLIFLFGVLPSIQDNFTKVINPEYHAIQRIVDQVKP